MIEYFTEKEYKEAKKQRNLTLTAYLIVMGIYIAFSIAMLVWYRTLPYKSPTIKTVKWVHYPVTVVAVLFSVLFLGIKFKRVNRYYQMAFNLMYSRRETSVGSFLEYREDLQEKDGVDCKSLIFIEWNKYKKDYFERKVLVLYEKEFPKIPENANVEYVTQANVLVSYKILEN